MPWVANRGEAWTEQHPQGGGETVCISITEPGRKVRLPSGYVDVLRLFFQDYDTTRGEKDGLKSHIPDTAELFTRGHAAKISRFARKWRGKNILVHCAAGISRSGAVAEALLQAFPEYEDKGWPRFPNGRVLTYTKRALGLIPLTAEEIENGDA